MYATRVLRDGHRASRSYIGRPRWGCRLSVSKMAVLWGVIPLLLSYLTYALAAEDAESGLRETGV